MTTTEDVLLIIITTLLSLLLITTIAVTIAIYQLVSAAKRAVVKAEGVIDSVESAAEVLRDTQGKLAFFKLISNIVKLVNGRHK